MSGVHVRILHVEPGDGAGPLERALAAARAVVADRQSGGFARAGAGDVRIVAGPPDGIPFGRRLRALAEEAADAGAGGLVVAGSGALALAEDEDFRAFVDVASGPPGHALANNRFSAGDVAVAGPGVLADVPEDLPGDNALPRWLAEVAGVAVDDLRARWRLGMDLDSPLDVVLARLGGAPAEIEEVLGDELAGRARERIAAVVRVAADPRAELVVAGRTSAATLAHLELHAAARVRALVEERGFRTAPAGQRPPRSVIATALDATGPGSLGALLAGFGDAAVVDSRVLLAHRLGRDERRWPAPEDRFASDLLLAGRVQHPWLRTLTAAAAQARIPILLGGHTLVGPGLRVVVPEIAT